MKRRTNRIPVGDFESIQTELIFSDLMTVENRIERLELGFKRGIKTAVQMQEHKLLQQLKEQLENDIPLRKYELQPEEQKIIRGFQLLTRKPLMIILNSEESRFGSSQEQIDKLESHAMTIEVCGKFEMELANLSDEDAELFMQDIGIVESVCDRLTKYSYDLLGYISFFTVGSPEVHAWTITHGTRAQEAAGKIHSDLERGFIRAECFTYNDLIELGSEKAIKEKGLFRLEGKDYIVQDARHPNDTIQRVNQGAQMPRNSSSKPNIDFQPKPWGILISAVLMILSVLIVIASSGDQQTLINDVLAIRDHGLTFSKIIHLNLPQVKNPIGNFGVLTGYLFVSSLGKWITISLFATIFLFCINYLFLREIRNEINQRLIGLFILFCFINLMLLRLPTYYEINQANPSGFHLSNHAARL